MAGVALGTLIRETRTANGWSVREVAEHASSRGERLDKTAVSDWENHGMATLVPDRVRALAVGLRLPTYRVACAQLADMGIVVPLDLSTATEAIERDHRLPADLRRELLKLIHSRDGQ